MILQSLRQLAIAWMQNQYDPNSKDDPETWYAHANNIVHLNLDESTQQSSPEDTARYIGSFSEEHNPSEKQRNLYIASIHPKDSTTIITKQYDHQSEIFNKNNFPFISKGRTSGYYSPIFLIKKENSKEYPTDVKLRNTIKDWIETSKQENPDNHDNYHAQLLQALESVRTIELPDGQVQTLNIKENFKFNPDECDQPYNNPLIAIRHALLQREKTETWFAIQIPDCRNPQPNTPIAPGLHHGFQAYYQNAVFKRLYSTKKATPIPDTLCALCGIVTEVYPTGVSGSGWSFFAQKHSPLFPQLNQGRHGNDSTQRFPICLPCAHALHVSRTQILPQFTLKNLRNNEKVTLSGQHIVWLPNLLPINATTTDPETLQQSWSLRKLFKVGNELHEFFGSTGINQTPIDNQSLQTIHENLHQQPFSWTMLIMMTGKTETNPPEAVFTGIRTQYLYNLRQKLYKAYLSTVSSLHPISNLRTDPNRDMDLSFRWMECTSQFYHRGKERAAKENAQWLKNIATPLIQALLQQKPIPWKPLQQQELHQWHTLRNTRESSHLLNELIDPAEQNIFNLTRKQNSDKYNVPGWLAWQRWEWLYHTLEALERNRNNAGGDFTMELTPHKPYLPKDEVQQYYAEQTQQPFPCQSTVFREPGIRPLAFWTGVLAGKLAYSQYARGINPNNSQLAQILRGPINALTIPSIFNKITKKLLAYGPSPETKLIMEEAGQCSLHIAEQKHSDEAMITHAFLLGITQNKTLLPSKNPKQPKPNDYDEANSKPSRTNSKPQTPPLEHSLEQITLANSPTS